MTKFGVGFACSGLLLLGAWWLYVITRQCQPVHMPLTTLVGNIRTNEFTVNIRNRYFIELEAQKTIPFARLNCLLGMKEPSPLLGENETSSRDCTADPSVVNVEWALLRDGIVAQRGSSADTPYGGWADNSISRDLGDFYGSPGHRYEIALHFATGATPLSVTNPYLNVSVNPAFIEGTMFLTGLVIDPAAGALLLIGIILLLISFLRTRRQRRITELAHAQ
jgi:hypothetical protein